MLHGVSPMCEFERRFWTEGVDFYRAHLAAGCVMVFPLPVGQLVDDQILASIGRADRWRDVVIDPTALYPVTDDVMIFSYRAWAERSSAAPYACHATSVYRLGDSAWLLAFHQQTQLEYVTQPKADTRALVEIDGRR